MLKRMTAGAAAGAIATGPMSAVVWGFRRLGIYRRGEPPEEITEKALRPLVDPSDLPQPVRAALKTSSHVGFGAASGALFGALSAIVPPSPTSGALVGLAIWKSSYDGWLPALGLLPPPGRDEHGRVVTMVSAHLVYGAVLGGLLGRWLARHSE